MRSGCRHWALLTVVLLLGACASDATFTRQNGLQPDPKQVEADASACRSFWPLVGGFFVGAAYGAAQGALVGAASGGADVGAIIGAGAGGVIGLTIGAVQSAAGDGYERCMSSKGYVQAETPIRSDDVPPTETAARPMTPDYDPAR